MNPVVFILIVIILIAFVGSFAAMSLVGLIPRRWEFDGRPLDEGEGLLR